MKKIDVTQPYAMTSPFADGVYSSVSTNDFEIPAETSTAPDDTCVIDDGFLPITSTDLDDGGIAPERKNFNGMFYLSTDQRFYLQNGGGITYNSNVATAIGGYPQDAVLSFINSQGTYKLVRSLIDDNTNDFTQDETLIDGEHWEEIEMGGGSGYQMFDIVMKDHVLDYAETLGLAPLGTYVYKEAIAGTRYGYPYFYQKCVDEYNESTSQSEYVSSNYVQMVGTITDNEGVLSGFSNGNYILSQYISIPAGATWEYVTKFNSSDHSTTNIIGGFGNQQLFSLSTDINTDGTLSVFISSNSSNYDIANGVRSSLTLNDNTDYYMKRYFTGTEYKVDISTTGAFSGEETNYITVNSTTSIFSTNCPVDIAGWMNNGTFTGFRGTIDLNGCYININGERWWTGTTRRNWKVNSNKHRFYDIADKATFDNMYAITGEAWYYGIDTTNERIFLPRSTRFRNGSTSEVGNYQPAGLPNITGELSASHTTREWTGAFVRTQNLGFWSNGSSGWGGSLGYFDASRSSSIYGASDTVEYSSTKLIPYMVVGNQSSWSGMTDVVNNGLEILQEVNEGLATKLDAETVHIIDTYENQRSGYIIYSNGYCEQWGYFAYTNVTVSLLKTYKNTDYNILFGKGFANNTNTRMPSVNNNSITTNSFYVSGVFNNTSGTDCYFWWRTCGYLAEGQY